MQSVMEKGHVLRVNFFNISEFEIKQDKGLDYCNRSNFILVQISHIAKKKLNIFHPHLHSNNSKKLENCPSLKQLHPIK